MLEVIIKDKESGETRTAIECGLIVFGATRVNGDPSQNLFNITGEGRLPYIEMLHHAKCMGITIKDASVDEEMAYMTALGCIREIADGVIDKKAETHVLRDTLGIARKN
jgi:hypothetical protein